MHKPAEIEDETIIYDYDHEMLLLVGDWYHKSTDELLKKYLHWSSAGAEPVPSSVLVNGMGFYNCSMIGANSDLQCIEGIEVPELGVDAGKKYRFRVVNVGSVSPKGPGMNETSYFVRSLAGLTISISRSKMSAIQVDGGNKIKEHTKVESVGVLYPGERVDLILELDDLVESHQLEVTLDQE